MTFGEIQFWPSKGRAALVELVVGAAFLASMHGDALAEDLSSIENGAFSRAQGVVQVNAAAGDRNAEVNAASILKAREGPASGSQVSIHQLGSLELLESGGVSSAAIFDNAFQGASGLIMVNVAAGSNNQLANATSVLLGGSGKPVNDAVLSQGHAPSDAKYGTRSKENSRGNAKIDDSAFAGASGVIQVTVAGGSGNRLANELALNVGVGARP